jgi:predicted nucleic acid-binding Zn ribbon protein
VTRFGPHRRGERVSGILHRALEGSGVGRHLPRRVSASLWESAVGPELAARAQPTVLSAGILHVLVQDHRWRDQLDAARLTLLERLNRKLGRNAVRALQFGLAHQGALDEARQRARACACAGIEVDAVSPERVLGGARLEPGLREAVLRAAEAAGRRRT